MATPEARKEQIATWQRSLPMARNPTVLVCGSAGRGKTTAINTLFGREVGRVGHFSRGTDADELYEWESDGALVNVVDLPGLGDSQGKDRLFGEIYRRRVKEADAFLVITTPPRPD